MAKKAKQEVEDEELDEDTEDEDMEDEDGDDEDEDEDEAPAKAKSKSKAKTAAKPAKAAKSAKKPAKDDDGFVTLQALADEAEIEPQSARVKLRESDLDKPEGGRWRWKEGSKDLKAARKVLGL